MTALIERHFLIEDRKLHLHYFREIESATQFPYSIAWPE
jgi:hypothetical protein